MTDGKTEVVRGEDVEEEEEEEGRTEEEWTERVSSEEIKDLTMFVSTSQRSSSCFEDKA